MDTAAMRCRSLYAFMNAIRKMLERDPSFSFGVRETLEKTVGEE